MQHTRLAALALAAAILTVSGCGGSSKTSSTTTAASTTAPATTASTTTATSTKTATGPPLTRIELIAKAEPICARANAELNSTTIKSRAELARALPQAAAYDQVEATELSNLVPPASMASDWKQIIAGLQTFGDDTDKAGEDLESGSSEAAGSVYAAAKKGHEQLVAIAKRDGFKQCAFI